MKPPECEGCPLYDAPGPVDGHGPVDAPAVFVGEAPANTEIETGVPFSGGSGRILDAMLRGAKTFRSAIRTENCVRCQVPNNDMDAFPQAEEAIEHCGRAFLIPYLKSNSYVRVVVPLGNSANWLLTERCTRDRQGHPQPMSGIYTYRGYPFQSPLYNFTIVPTIHPAAIMRDKTMWKVVVADIARAMRYAEEGYKRPAEEFIYATEPEEVEGNLEVMAKARIPIVVDIENPGGNLVCVGFSLGLGFAICIPFINDANERYWGSEERELRVIRAIYKLLADPDVVKIAQFAQHERFWLMQYGFVLRGVVWDTMAMHAMIYPAYQHNLRFIASIHTNRPEWKSMVPEWSEESEEVDK